MFSDNTQTALLGRLTLAVSAAVHRRALVAAVGDALAREVDASGVEMWLSNPDHDDAFTVIGWQQGQPVVEREVRALDVSPGARPKMRRTRGHLEILVPLPIASRRIGQLAIWFQGTEAPPVALETDLLLAIGCVVGLACHGIDLITKVAGLSRRAHQEKQHLQRRLTELGDNRPIVAVSRAMREVLDQIELVAAHPTTVLIRGESGTGKELLARHVHQRSERSAAPFVAVNCAALPDALIESELFGHEKGAFTGAIERHIGRFERAHGGTLFLDEVAELPLSAQAKLLRALQEGVIERVGGRESVSIDVRIVAATHRVLEDMLEDGRFRTDLFYRLNVFPVHVPPLRDRPEDIPELARAKLRHMSVRLGREVPHLTQQHVRTLCSQAWPGNVRELENYLERALILSANNALRLPSAVVSSAHVVAKQALSSSTLNDAVKRAIQDALERTRGKLYGADGAAALLGMKPSTLQSKMVKLKINRATFGRGDGSSMLRSHAGHK